MTDSRSFRAGALLAVLGGLALLLGRHLGSPSEAFDEGVYLASGAALAHGADLGSQVFASQPPLFFSGLTWAWKLTGGDVGLMHAIALAVALFGCAAAFALIRPVAGTTGGLVAVALVGLAFSNEAAVIKADVPSVALGLAGLAAGDRASRSPGWAFAAGGLTVAGVLVKLLALPFMVALAALMISRRLSRRAVVIVIAGAAVVAAAVLAAHASALPILWDQVIAFPAGRRSGSPDQSPLAEIAGQWVLPAGLLVLTAALTALNRPPSWPAWLRDRAPLVTLLVAGLLLLSQLRPLHPGHLVIVSTPLALLAASACPRRPALLAVGGAAAAVALAVNARPLLSASEARAVRQSAAIVQASTRPAQQIVSDLPLVPLAAHRAAVPTTIDSSRVRVRSGSLSSGAFLTAVRDAGAVVIGRNYKHFRHTDRQLRDRFPIQRRVSYDTPEGKHLVVSILLRRGVADRGG